MERHQSKLTHFGLGFDEKDGEIEYFENFNNCQRDLDYQRHIVKQLSSK